LRGYQADSFDIELVNMAGRTVDKETFTNNVSELYTLQLNPPAGVYVLKVTGTGLKKSSKVIVQ